MIVKVGQRRVVHLAFEFPASMMMSALTTPLCADIKHLHIDDVSLATPPLGPGTPALGLAHPLRSDRSLHIIFISPTTVMSTT
jgi:hypothetical protein